MNTAGTDSSVSAVPLDPALAADCLRNLLQQVPALIYFKDRDSRFIAVSEAKARRHGLAADDMVGKCDADFFADESARWRLVDEESIMGTGEMVEAKLEQLTWRDGREGWVETSKMPLRDESGAVIGTFGLSYDVTDRQRITHEFEKTRRAFVDASRLAGMAEVATGVLHNVGNVLTSLNVSAGVLSSGLRYSKTESLARVAQLLEEHGADLGAFLTTDPKGRRIPEFLASLAGHMIDERTRLLNELTAMQQNIDHIKEIITMQQSYATMAGIVEVIDPATLVEDALRMNAGALLRHSVAVVREFHPVPKVRAEKAKVLQILVNLIRNAKYACDDGGGVDKIVTLQIQPGAKGRVHLTVRDNGIGIPPENLERIFHHGFTTRTHGHGFGLHSARIAAVSMNATVSVDSAGIGQGAAFTLDLPVAE